MSVAPSVTLPFVVVTPQPVIVTFLVAERVIPPHVSVAFVTLRHFPLRRMEPTPVLASVALTGAALNASQTPMPRAGDAERQSVFTLTRLAAVPTLPAAVRVRFFAVRVAPPLRRLPLVVRVTPLQQRCVAPMERQPEVRWSVRAEMAPPVLQAVSLLLQTEIVRLQAAFADTLPAPTSVRVVGSTVSLSTMFPVVAVADTVALFTVLAMPQLDCKVTWFPATVPAPPMVFPVRQTFLTA